MVWKPTMTKRRELLPCCKTYGFPVYCAACVPINRISPSPTPSADTDDRLFVALGGGGGEGRSGVPNVLVLSAFDYASGSLSDHPVCRLETGKELPYRMALHPGGDGIICSFPNSCRWFEWDFPESEQPSTLVLKSSEKVLTQLADVGQQLALAFDAEGSILAVGGEDGHLRVFKWPSMEIIIDENDAHTSVKDLDFSSDSKYLVSLWSSGPCRVWDLTSSTVAASLSREDGEKFGFCRFSQSTDGNQMICVTAMHGDHGKILSWNLNSWGRVGSKKITRDSISAFTASTDGKLLALGTVEGNILILNSPKLQVLKTVKKAHIGLVTALVFSQDSRALVSTSFDYTASVTLNEDKKKSGLSMSLIILVVLLSVLVYLMIEKMYLRLPAI
ncbi:SEC12-like protein 2 [Iris pallida]|uniref:SEC12-like protein 2 n=1 Tax=Iris pallida TaxID=29817 RepID=A0AAX6EUY6_IRIPA|nr:SEC12-like protein 2 [Iris pallida]KAJ6807877.1 SEC12-like protein 2 [Iris pallida]